MKGNSKIVILLRGENTFVLSYGLSRKHCQTSGHDYSNEPNGKSAYFIIILKFLINRYGFLTIK